MNEGSEAEGKRGKERGNKYHQTQGLQIPFLKVGSSLQSGRKTQTGSYWDVLLFVMTD